MDERKRRRLVVLGLVICVCTSVLCSVMYAQAAGTDEKSAKKELIDAYRRGKKSLDVEKYDISQEQWREIFKDVMQSGEIPWYCSYPSSTISMPSGQMQEIVLDYLDPSEYDYDQYEKNAQRILDEALYPGMNDWQKALAIHDRLVEWGQYDRNFTYYTGYDYLVRGTAGCAGYSDAYMDLMNRAGVRCVRTNSLEMNHTWNLVEIDGEWYHVDVTWDDPIPNEQGRVYHTYFLKTDEEFSNGEKPHYYWNKDWNCDNTRFSEAYWNSLGSGIIYLSSDACLFCTKDELLGITDIYVHNDSTEENTLLCELPEEGLQKGMRLGGRMWGLSMWNGLLYTGYGNTVYTLQQDGSNLHGVYQLDDEEMQIRGAVVRDNQIFMTVSEFGGTDFSEKTESLPKEYTGMYMRGEHGRSPDQHKPLENMGKDVKPRWRYEYLLKIISLGIISLVLTIGGIWLLVRIFFRFARARRTAVNQMEFRTSGLSFERREAQMGQRISRRKDSENQKIDTNPFHSSRGYSEMSKK